jgi:SAM-dependent methyltransferase
VPTLSEGGTKFNGSIPSFYDRFFGPFCFEPYAADLARRITAGPGARVLELACGTGILTRRLRDVLPAGAQLVATDLSAPMLEHARAKLAGADVHWRTADAQALPFKDGVFDAVVCQFGLMFLPDKPAGFREARRVLRAGGAFVASTWCAIDENPAARIVAETILRLVPDDPPRFHEIPHGFHDVPAIERMAREAGFHRVEIARVDLEGRAPSARHVATGFVRGTPLAAMLAERRVDHEGMINAVARALHSGDDAIPHASPLSALVVTAS